MVIERKWRPTLPMITAGMIGAVLFFAIGGFAIVRFNAAQSALTEIATAALLALVSAGTLGFVFVRTVLRPLRELRARATAIIAGDRSAIGPLRHYGTRELAGVTQGFMDMAQSLSAQSDYLRTFQRHISHELKTPLTSIRGAAELMLDNADMNGAERARFLRNIGEDVERMSLLLERLSDLARAERAELNGATTLGAVSQALCARFSTLHCLIEGDVDTVLALPADSLEITLGHLLDNAVRHGATRVRINATTGADLVRIHVEDDGPGVSAGNRDRIFDPFFTTRRAEGGTGMGLAIVRALLAAHGGAIRLLEGEGGARFLIEAPQSAQSLHDLS